MKTYGTYLDVRIKKCPCNELISWLSIFIFRDAVHVYSPMLERYALLEDDILKQLDSRK